MRRALLILAFASWPLVVGADTQASLWRLAAEMGSAGAQLNLGVMYDFGQGVPEDDVEAVKWYCKVAEQGLAEAQHNLATQYFAGEGVPEDHAEAASWFRKAAEQGLAMAQFSLGVMYDLGHGVPEDDAEAVKWYRKAAEQGRAEAQLKLATKEAVRDYLYEPCVVARRATLKWGGSPAALGASRTARSFPASIARTAASCALERLTVTRPQFSTTWWLVTISPAELTRKRRVVKQCQV